MTGTRPFHLAIPVEDLKTSCEFYGEKLGFQEGRSDKKWVDYDFFGHQFVLHETGRSSSKDYNPVDGHQVPVPHFGIIMEWNNFFDFAELIKQQGIEFEIEPYIRFKGKPGEQITMFFYDPSGNALEFKAFKNDDQLFAQ
jgi:extradiol dioxygenase family protein